MYLRGKNVFIICIFVCYYFNWIVLLKFKGVSVENKDNRRQRGACAGIQLQFNLAQPCRRSSKCLGKKKKKDARGSLSCPVYVYCSQNSQTHFSVAGRRRQFKFEPPSPVSTVQLSSWSNRMSSSRVALLSQDAALLLACRMSPSTLATKQHKTNKVFTSPSTLTRCRPKPTHCGEETAKKEMVEFD